MARQMGYNLTPTGRYSPLRYPGGKGKVARFVADLLRTNELVGGTYVEPYAGGAAVAWELLLTGLVRRIEINDISRPIFAFWSSVLNNTDSLCRKIVDTPVNVDSWAAAKKRFDHSADQDDLALGFAMFFLNRTNRSGILNGGPIGGRSQTGPWKIDARYSKLELISRIERIAAVASRVSLTNMDAVELLKEREASWDKRTLVYLDPPYYVKGGQLYYDFYRPSDHEEVAQSVRKLERCHWLVSYDDAGEVRKLYPRVKSLRYSIGYSAREHAVGTEIMFFAPGLVVPAVTGSMVELVQ